MTRIRVAVTDSKLSHAFAFGFIEMSGLRPGRSRRRGLKPCPTSEYLIRTFDFPSRSLNFASPQTSTGRRVLINCAYHRSRTGESGDSSLSINNSGREFPRCCFLSFLPSFFPSFFIARTWRLLLQRRRKTSHQAFNSISRDSCLMEDNKLTANRVILIMN